MARTAKIVKELKKAKFKVRKRNRCRVCGRARGYIRKFQMCRICFRGMALKGEIPRVTKASWEENYADGPNSRFSDAPPQRGGRQAPAFWFPTLETEAGDRAHPHERGQ